MKETRQRGGGAEKQPGRRGRKGADVVECGRGPGIHARRSWPMLGYLCIYVEHRRTLPMREREREKKRGERKGTWEQEEQERTREAFSCEREGQGRREEPMASQGVLPFRYEGASRYVHLREHPTMQQEHQETNDSHPTITTATPPIVLLSF